MNDTKMQERKKLLKILLVILDLTPTKIAKALHVSNSVVSKHLSGEKLYRPCDLYLIELAFKIQVKDFNQCI